MAGIQCLFFLDFSPALRGGEPLDSRQTYAGMTDGKYFLGSYKMNKILFIVALTCVLCACGRDKTQDYY
ncbi:MAG: hypothetical protein LBE50_03560, partial [Gallionellaceae bacterium]|nr:hypothetical protein [Gallionellaceae bacterium]